MSLLTAIRQELQTLHGLIKTPSTATEKVVQERVGVVHDNLVQIEARFGVVEISALKAVRALAEKADANALKHVDSVVAHAEKHAQELQEAAEKAQAAQQQAQQAQSEAPAAEAPTADAAAAEALAPKS